MVLDQLGGAFRGIFLPILGLVGVAIVIYIMTRLMKVLKGDEEKKEIGEGQKKSIAELQRDVSMLRRIFGIHRERYKNIFEGLQALYDETLLLRKKPRIAGKQCYNIWTGLERSISQVLGDETLRGVAGKITDAMARIDMGVAAVATQ